MTAMLSKEGILATPKGDVRIRLFCNPDDIRQYVFDCQFGIIDGYRSLYTQRDSLEKIAELTDTNVVLAVAEPKNIIGYGVLAYPDPAERWAELDLGIMMEIKAIEVCRAWRSAGIASQIIKMMLERHAVEEMIIYLVGYSWTWDLKGTHKTGQAYRKMLIKIFEPFGFLEYETNEPNVCLKPENILMCRIGINVSQMIKDRFKWLRFGLSPWTWKVDEK